MSTIAGCPMPSRSLLSGEESPACWLMTSIAPVKLVSFTGYSFATPAGLARVNRAIIKNWEICRGKPHPFLVWPPKGRIGRMDTGDMLTPCRTRSQVDHRLLLLRQTCQRSACRFSRSRAQRSIHHWHDQTRRSDSHARGLQEGRAASARQCERPDTRCRPT